MVYRILLLLAVQSAFGSETVFPLEEFSAYFQSVWVEDNKLCLHFGDRTGPLAHPTGDGRGEIIRAGETVKLQFSEKTKLIERHSGLTFDPLPAPLTADGFSIASYFDSTSVGGGKTVKKAFLVKVPTNAGAQPELRWLSPDTPLTEIVAIVHGQKSGGEQLSTNLPPPTPPTSTSGVHSSPAIDLRSQSPAPSVDSSAHKSRVKWPRSYALWAAGIPIAGFLIYILMRSRRASSPS